MIRSTNYTAESIQLYLDSLVSQQFRTLFRLEIQVQNAQYQESQLEGWDQAQKVLTQLQIRVLVLLREDLTLWDSCLFSVDLGPRSEGDTTPFVPHDQLTIGDIMGWPEPMNKIKLMVVSWHVNVLDRWNRERAFQQPAVVALNISSS